MPLQTTYNDVIVYGQIVVYISQFFCLLKETFYAVCQLEQRLARQLS